MKVIIFAVLFIAMQSMAFVSYGKAKQMLSNLPTANTVMPSVITETGESLYAVEAGAESIFRRF